MPPSAQRLGLGLLLPPCDRGFLGDGGPLGLGKGGFAGGAPLRAPRNRARMLGVIGARAGWQRLGTFPKRFAQHPMGDLIRVGAQGSLAHGRNLTLGYPQANQCHESNWTTPNLLPALDLEL